MEEGLNRSQLRSSRAYPAGCMPSHVDATRRPDSRPAYNALNLLDHDTEC